uniref:Protein phosphatase 4 regulatory subunit 2 n=1 Tax=Taeniopygia guttata TaxID=59729 RepID=A0A674H433_TAEGU
MDVERLQEALKDFEKRGKKEVCPILDQFLCHVAKTGETMVQWSQFKGYFIFKLEKVMDDFRTSAPEPRGPPNPNVEYIPFEEMKERILKIVTGFNGIPFTIQRLCELLTDPRRNYTGTDKFLRGVEKNVMVVSCVYPSSEKNNSSSLNRMNGVMFPGNSPGYTDRSNVNGPGTPRPVSRTKVSLSAPMTTNGLPDSTEHKEPSLQQTEEKKHSESPASESEGAQSSPVKNKHSEDDPAEAEGHEVKRLKFDKEGEARDASNQTASSEVSSGMGEETEASSTSQDKEKDASCARQHCTEEEESPSCLPETLVRREKIKTKTVTPRVWLKGALRRTVGWRSRSSPGQRRICTLLTVTSVHLPPAELTAVTQRSWGPMPLKLQKAPQRPRWKTVMKPQKLQMNLWSKTN